jgi:hypothetical protein
LAFVTMKQEDRVTLLAFEEAAAAIPNVLRAQSLSGLFASNLGRGLGCRHAGAGQVS